MLYWEPKPTRGFLTKTRSKKEKKENIDKKSIFFCLRLYLSVRSKKEKKSTTVSIRGKKRTKNDIWLTTHRGAFFDTDSNWETTIQNKKKCVCCFVGCLWRFSFLHRGLELQCRLWIVRRWMQGRKRNLTPKNICWKISKQRKATTNLRVVVCFDGTQNNDKKQKKKFALVTNDKRTDCALQTQNKKREEKSVCKSKKSKKKQIERGIHKKNKQQQTTVVDFSNGVLFFLVGVEKTPPTIIGNAFWFCGKKAQKREEDARKVQSSRKKKGKVGCFLGRNSRVSLLFSNLCPPLISVCLDEKPRRSWLLFFLLWLWCNKNTKVDESVRSCQQSYASFKD